MRRAATLLLSKAAASSSSCSSSSSSSAAWRVGGRSDAIDSFFVGGGDASSSTTTSSNLFSVLRRSFAIPCNLKLGAVPPPPLIVRYSRGGADAFIELADELEEAVPGLMVEGKEEGDESGGGKEESGGGKGGSGGGNEGSGGGAKSDSRNGSDGGSITQVIAPGGQVLLSASASGKPVVARDVLSALERWQRDQEAPGKK